MTCQKMFTSCRYDSFFFEKESKNSMARKWHTLACSQSVFKGALSGLRNFFATESSLKMMKNTFDFTLKSLFVLKIFKFLS